MRGSRTVKNKVSAVGGGWFRWMNTSGHKTMYPFRREHRRMRCTCAGSVPGVTTPN